MSTLLRAPREKLRRMRALAMLGDTLGMASGILGRGLRYMKFLDNNIIGAAKIWHVTALLDWLGECL